MTTLAPFEIALAISGAVALIAGIIGLVQEYIKTNH